MLLLVFPGALAAAGSVAPCSAGEIRQSEPLVPTASPRFVADANAYLTPQGTALGLDLEIPYTELQFIRVKAGYGAAVRITVVFLAGGSRTLGGDVWEERFVVADFEMTRDSGAHLRLHRDFSLPAGDCRLEVTLLDLNGGRESSARSQIRVPEFGAGALGLGDLQFGFCSSDSGFVSVPSRRFEADLASLCVRGAIYDRRSDEAVKSYVLRYTVRDESGSDVAHGDTTVAGGASEAFTLRPAVEDLFLGSYTFELEVAEGRRKWRASRAFEVETLTMPRGQNYVTVIEILAIIGSDQEIEALRKAVGTERIKLWDAFWAKRDPTPDTPRNEALIEFFRRVRYANQHFSGYSSAGWRTDQGRIYIRYGPPDQIEDRPATFSDPPLQIWHYYALNRQFVFADREGFGRFELISPGVER